MSLWKTTGGEFIVDDDESEILIEYDERRSFLRAVDRAALRYIPEHKTKKILNTGPQILMSVRYGNVTLMTGAV